MTGHLDYLDGFEVSLYDEKSEVGNKWRYFSEILRDTNRPFLQVPFVPKKLVRVCFLLPKHFSLMAFSAAVDALVAANLVYPEPLFSFKTYGLESAVVQSDLGIDITTDGVLITSGQDSLESIDVLIVGGSFRCSLTENKALSSILCGAEKSNKVLGGIWNGAIHLASAGLLDNVSCALHPDNHAYMNERFKNVKITKEAVELDSGFITCAGPASAQEMMLTLIEQLQGKEVKRAVKVILSCDQATDTYDRKLSEIFDSPVIPNYFREIVKIMSTSIEEPVSIRELVALSGLSRRQIERQFQAFLGSSPYKFYLELRVTYSRRLLLQTSDPVFDVALACGFISASHFSKCFKSFYGVSPSQLRETFWAE